MFLAKSSVEEMVLNMYAAGSHSPMVLENAGYLEIKSGIAPVQFNNETSGKNDLSAQFNRAKKIDAR